MDHNLETVDNSRTDWRVRVRITRMWPSFANNQHFVGFNLILLDSEDFHLLAFVYPVVWNSIGNMILEGNAYDIENFVVREPIGRMRPVSSDKVIVFTISTMIQPVPLGVVTIPRHKFEVKPFGEVYDLARNYSSDVSPLYAIDILGAAQNIEPVKHVNTHIGEKTFVRFELYDGSNVIKVVVWDELTDHISPLFEGNFDNPPIVIMTTMKPRIFHGSLQVSTSGSSRIFINVEYEAVQLLRQRLLDEEYEANLLAP